METAFSNELVKKVLNFICSSESLKHFEMQMNNLLN